MKKMVSIITIFIVLFILMFSIKVYAASLDTIDISIDKQTVHPGENITVNIQFGQNLGAYTFDVAYDNNLLEYVSAEGGTANDTGTKVRVYYFDQTGGTSPRTNMSVTFKAKEGITTSNPTDLSITAEGLANADASVNYDDITTPIIKNVIVEPVYVDYSIALNYSGNVIENKEKDMQILISSIMGKNYEHTRIIAEATSTSGGTAKLLGTDSQGLEHDIIQSGWGDASGDSIGGQNVQKELNVKGLFTKAGDYSITLKLIDRDNSDAAIASQNFTVTVGTEDITPPTDEGDDEQLPPENEEDGEEVPPTTGTETNKPSEDESKDETNNTPQTLPKTGNTVYFVIIPIVTLLVIAYICLRKKD